MREPDTGVSALSLRLDGAAATEALGAALAGVLRDMARERHLLVLLGGELGVGKTTLVRGLLRALGHEGRVPSPTYTLIEPYRVPDGFTVLHLDLYRLADGDELEQLGWRDEVARPGLSLIEWPERAAWLSARAALTVRLEGAGGFRRATLHAADPDLARRLAGSLGGRFGLAPE